MKVSPLSPCSELKIKPGFVNKQTPRKQTRNEIMSDLVNFSFRITFNNKKLNIGNK